MQPPVALETIDDLSQVRIVLWQSRRFCSVPPVGLGAIGSIAGLIPADGAFIVGDGSAWVAESGATARTSLGLGTIATQDASNVAITGGSITGITDLAIADGGTGASTASGARSNLGLGTIATQDANNVNIDGGSIDGASIGSGSASTGAFTTISATGTADLLGGLTTGAGEFVVASAGQTDWGNFTTTPSVNAHTGKQIPGTGTIIQSSRGETGNNSHLAFYDRSGGLAGRILTDGAGNTSYLTTSDGRLKEGHEDFDSGPIIDAIRITSYEMFGKRMRGVASAQELHAVFPEAVTVGSGEPDDEGFQPWGVDHGKLASLAIKELQELRKRVGALENASASR